MRSLIRLGALGIGLALATSSGDAKAATGDSTVVGYSGGSLSGTVGNSKAGAIYLDTTVSSYEQWPDNNGGPQRIGLSATSARSLVGTVHDKTIPVLSLTASADGSRQGSHMTGEASARIQVNGNVVWEDTHDYDVTSWNGSEASVSKTHQVWSYSKAYTALIPVGPASVNLKGTLGGSLGVSATASSDFSTGSVRKGIISAATSAEARADLHASASFGIPYVGSLGVYADINVMTLTIPAVAVASWDWDRDRPNASANNYSAVAINNIRGETGGGTFGAKLLGPLNVEIASKQLASWNGKQLFVNAFVNQANTDVGAFQ